MRETSNQSLGYLLLALESRFKELIEPSSEQSCASGKDGRYTYIPLGIPQFLGALEKAATLLPLTRPVQQGLRTINFIDVGAGWGSKALLAERYLQTLLPIYLRGTSAYHVIGHGLEYNEKYAPHHILNKGTYIKGDALEYTEYAKYDIIYFYCPMYDSSMQSRFEELVYNQAAEGTIFLQFLKRNSNWAVQPNLHHINGSNSLFIKTADKELCQRAKRALNPDGIFSSWDRCYACEGH